MGNTDWAGPIPRLLVGSGFVVLLVTLIVVGIVGDWTSAKGTEHISNVEDIHRHIREVEGDGVTTWQEWLFVCDTLTEWQGQLQGAIDHLLQEDSTKAARALYKARIHARTLDRRFRPSCVNPDDDD